MLQTFQIPNDIAQEWTSAAERSKHKQNDTMWESKRKNKQKHRIYAKMYLGRRADKVMLLFFYIYIHIQ